MSLSGCVKDLINGKVSVDQVEKIVAGTSCRTPADWEMLITEYSKSYWRANPEKAKEFVLWLLVNGKIYQPRLDPSNGRSPRLATEKGIIHWVDSEDQISWF